MKTARPDRDGVDTELDDDYARMRDLFIDWQNPKFEPAHYDHPDHPITLHYRRIDQMHLFEHWRDRRQAKRASYKRIVENNMKLGQLPHRHKMQKAQRVALALLVRSCIKSPTPENLADLHGQSFSLLIEQVGESLPALKLLDQQHTNIETGFWKAVDWDNEHWACQSHNPLYWFHMVHVSETDPTMVAYTQTVDKLMRGIKTRTKPGRYLAQFFPHLSPDEIRDWTHTYQAAHAPAHLEYVSNTEPDAWVEVYNHPVQASGSSYTSCMHGESCVSVYARPGNDLTLIFIRKGENVIARAIGRESRKEYVRAYTYTSELSSSTFESMLEKEGWTLDSSCLEGVKLNRVESRSQLKCPYLDGDYQCVEDHGSYIVISDSGMEATNTGGWIDLESRATCAECGDSCHDDDLNYIESEDAYVCEDCVNRHYVKAYGRHDYTELFKENDCVSVNGRYYHEDNLDRHDIYCCEYSGNYYHMDDTTRLACGMIVGNDQLRYFVELDVRSASEDSDYAESSDVVELSDGRKVYCDDAEELQAELDADAESDAESESDSDAQIDLDLPPVTVENANPIPRQSAGWPFPIPEAPEART